MKIKVRMIAYLQNFNIHMLLSMNELKRLIIMVDRGG